MQFNVTTDYAIRTVLVLAAENRMMTADEISTQMSIPFNYLQKIVRKLVVKGILRTKRGRYGGFLLGMKAGEITLYDIISTMEPTIAINRCTEKDCYCNRNAVAACPVRDIYSNMQKNIECELKNHTIAEMITKINKELS